MDTIEEELKKVDIAIEKQTAEILSRHSVPEGVHRILGDVRNLNFEKIGQKHNGFDAVLMDIPWILTSGSRGVQLPYDTMPNEVIESMDIGQLQTDGLIFMWVLNSTQEFALELLKKWGYKFVYTRVT